MKFAYGYKTSANEPREGTISASSRDEAYRKLKESGIRPFRVVLAPGFLNKIASFGKRGFAIALLSVALVMLLVVFWMGDGMSSRMQPLDETSPLPRHQIYGDPAIWQEIELSGFATVFAHAGERFLAEYAIPGREIGSVAARDPVALVACLTNDIAFAADDPREVVELKRIVLGMKEELRVYLSSGKGTAKTYMRRLDERLAEEKRIRVRVVNELEGSNDPALWEARNRQLRDLGLRTIARPGRELPPANKPTGF